MKKYKIGDMVSAKVTGIKPYGVFVCVDDEYNGLVHISEISDYFVSDIEKYMKIGEMVDLKILEIDEVSKQIKLSLKSTAESKRPHRRYMKFSKEYNRDVSIFEKDFIDTFKVVEDAIAKKDSEKVVISNFDYYGVIDFLSFKEQVSEIHQKIHDLNSEHKDYLGWVEFVNLIKEEELKDIIETANRVKEKHNTLVICGVGGSSLGIKAGVEMLNIHNKSSKVEVIFMGENFSSAYINQKLDYLRGRDFVVNFISKSGSTLESSLAFRLLSKALSQKYGEENIYKRIFITSDSESSLSKCALKNNYKTFKIPSDVGGRYSVLTSVGLFPFAIADIDIMDLINGAKKAYSDLSSGDILENEAYKYAVARLKALENKKVVEVLSIYEPQLETLGKWWQQLFAESEGKNQKGLLPIVASYTNDLHSLGQYIQEGSPILFSTTLDLLPNTKEVLVNEIKDDFDNFNIFKNHNFLTINQVAMISSIKAHYEQGNVPNIVLKINRYDAFGLGYLFYFFMKSCAMSAYLLGVNPFNQPGVVVYKENIKKLLK